VPNQTSAARRAPRAGTWHFGMRAYACGSAHIDIIVQTVSRSYNVMTLYIDIIVRAPMAHACIDIMRTSLLIPTMPITLLSRDIESHYNDDYDYHYR